MKSGYDEQHIDDEFCKILKCKRTTLLKEGKKKHKKKRVSIRFITDFEPAFPSIKYALKSVEHKIKGDNLLIRMLPDGANSVQIAMRRGGKDIKEILATTKVNCNEERTQRIGHCGPCGKPCVHCPLLQKSSGNTFKSEVTKRTYKIRQHVDCTATMVVYLITCTKCNIQGVGSTEHFNKRASNYKSNIGNKKATCCIEEFFQNE